MRHGFILTKNLHHFFVLKPEEVSCLFVQCSSLQIFLLLTVYGEVHESKAGHVRNQLGEDDC